MRLRQHVIDERLPPFPWPHLVPRRSRMRRPNHESNLQRIRIRKHDFRQIQLPRLARSRFPSGASRMSAVTRSGWRIAICNAEGAPADPPGRAAWLMPSASRRHTCAIQRMHRPAWSSLNGRTGHGDHANARMRQGRGECHALVVSTTAARNRQEGNAAACFSIFDRTEGRCDNRAAVCNASAGLFVIGSETPRNNAPSATIPSVTMSSCF